MWHNTGGNKYGARRTEYNGRMYDSKYEALIAQELDLRMKAGEITEIEPQYKIEAWAYTEKGEKAFKVTHRIDFRVKLKNGTYELVEAKGVETTDYKWRKKFLEHIWLPAHPDHVYVVRKQH